MTEQDPFDRSLAERLQRAEARVPGVVPPHLASGASARPPWGAWAAGSLVVVGAIAAGLVMATMLRDRGGPQTGGSTESPTAFASRSIEPSPTAAPSLQPISEAPGLLAVGRDGDVYVRRADGSHLRQLTNDPAAYEQPLVWVNDGAQLIVTTRPLDPNAPTTLSSLDLDTGDLTELGFFISGGLSWSPDGASAAFGGNGEDGSGIVVLDVQAGSFRQLTHDGGTRPIRSPDGNLIAYGAFDGTSIDVKIVDLRNGAISSPAPDPTQDDPLRWVIADGRLRLAFSSYRGTDQTKFAARPWVVNADGTDLELLADSGLGSDLADPQPASWASPDGHWIASDCSDGVCIQSTSGDMTSHALPQTQGYGVSDLWLSWVPGGEYVVYATFDDRVESRSVVVAIPLPEGEPIRLTPEGISESAPAWQPASKD